MRNEGTSRASDLPEAHKEKTKIENRTEEIIALLNEFKDVNNQIDYQELIAKLIAEGD